MSGSGGRRRYDLLTVGVNGERVGKAKSDGNST